MDTLQLSNEKSYIQIAQNFLALLRQQFPITKSTQYIKLRKASDFASRLHIHVNSLNRVVKLYTGKTTTQNINERFSKESKGLLTRTDWPINTIALVLGFKEENHFSAFFRKHVGCTPTEYRVSKNRG